jgi:signal transduction histidine kinase
VTSTGARLLAWLRRRWVFVVATAVTILFVATMAVVVLRDAERDRELDAERQLRLDAIAEQARMNRMIAYDLCTGLNEANGALRRLLDDTIRLRPPSRPFTDEERAIAAARYRDLPERNCESAEGEKTYYDPPFPPTTGGS